MNDDPIEKQEMPPLVKRGVGVSQVWRKKLDDRVPLANLKALLTVIGWIVNYEFEEEDWQEVRSLLEGTDYGDQNFCDYEMVGSHSARLNLALDGSESVYLKTNVPAEVLPQLRLAIEIFSTFHVTE